VVVEVVERSTSAVAAVVGLVPDAGAVEVVAKAHPPYMFQDN
tara:strand:+ start:215 stop:340 length:126 start_codon:yes stop_codon:yes gene_type:complete